MYDNNVSSIREVTEIKEKIRDGFSVTPHTANVTVKGRDNR